MADMKKLDDFLADAGCFYLSTVDGDKPKCRPLGLHHFQDGQIYYGIGDFKEVYKQLKANPYTEIVACKGMKWVRIYGKAVFDGEDVPAVQEIHSTFMLRKLYADNGWTLMIFHLEDAKAEFIDMMTVADSFEF